MRAIGNNIIIRAVRKESKSSLILPDEKVDFYEVISVGNKVQEIIEGDKIHIQNYGMRQIDYNNERLYITDAENVYAKE